MRHKLLTSILAMMLVWQNATGARAAISSLRAQAFLNRNIMQDKVMRVLPVMDQARIDACARFAAHVIRMGALSAADLTKSSKDSRVFDFDNIPTEITVAFVRGLKKLGADLKTFNGAWEELLFEFLSRQHILFRDVKMTPQIGSRALCEMYRRGIPLSETNKQFCDAMDKLTNYLLFETLEPIPKRLQAAAQALWRVGAEASLAMVGCGLDRIAMYAEIGNESETTRIAQTFLSYFADDLFSRKPMRDAFLFNRSIVEGFLNPQHAEANDVGVVYLLSGSSYMYSQALQIAEARGTDASRLHAIYLNRRITENNDIEILRQYVAEEGLGKYKTLVVVDTGFNGTVVRRIPRILAGLPHPPKVIHARMLFLNRGYEVHEGMDVFGWNLFLRDTGSVSSQKAEQELCFVAHLLDSLLARDPRSPAVLSREKATGNLKPLLISTELPVFAAIIEDSIKKGTADLLSQNLPYPQPESEAWARWLPAGARAGIAAVVPEVEKDLKEKIRSAIYALADTRQPLEVTSYDPFGLLPGRYFAVKEQGAELDQYMVRVENKVIKAIWKLPSNGIKAGHGLFAAEHLDMQKEDTLIDIGTGPLGLFVVLAAYEGARKAYGVDINPDFVSSARKSAALSNFGRRIEIVEGDAFKPFGRLRVNKIIIHPPMTPAILDKHEGRIAGYDVGGSTGREVLDRIIADSPQHLLPGGKIIIGQFEFLGAEKDFGEPTSTFEVLRRYGFQPRVIASYEIPITPLLQAHLDHIRAIYPRYKFIYRNGKLWHRFVVIHGEYILGRGSKAKPRPVPDRAVLEGV